MLLATQGKGAPKILSNWMKVSQTVSGRGRIELRALGIPACVSNHRIKPPLQHVSSPCGKSASHHSALGKHRCSAEKRWRSSHFLQRNLFCLMERVRKELVEIHLEF